MIFVLFAVQLASAQEFRTFSGMFNNPGHPEYGSAGAVLPQVGSNGFGDAISSPGGIGRPNPRFISNSIFSQNTLLDDVRGLSAYTWAWGQFIDHDITRSDDGQNESLDIAVPPFDAFFDPSGSGDAVIPMHRSAYLAGTGTDETNPRQYTNSITAFIDASGIYGSSMAWANWLRTFNDGKLKMSAGNLLPFNTMTGELDAPVDPNAPAMAMPYPFVEKWFVSGDFRANENPFLTAIHTLFAREHNRLCDELKTEHPGWSDEMLFQQARKLVGAEIQAIVYEEWLPTLGMEVAAYNGYNPEINPGIMNIFSTAAYRYGHTTINNLMVRMDNAGNYMPEGDILLRDAYFNPTAIMEVGGIEPYFIGMATVVEQEFDCKVIDDLRNFLFGAPGDGGLDLAAININRGRERGLPDYNTVRADFGLPRLNDFSEFTSDPLTNQSFEFVYGDINNVDPWVGMLAENHMPGALFGPTAMTIIEQQFMALRDGDRFYYENDDDLTPEQKDWIKHTTLADVVRRNTPVTIIQENVFIAEPMLTATSEAAPAEEVAFKIYPNPASQYITLRVESSENQVATIQITDTQGRTMLEEKANLGRGTNTVSVSLPDNCPAGLYVVNIRSGERTGHQRLVVE